MSVKVIIGCRSYLFSKGLHKLLEGVKDVDVVCIFNTGDDLKEALELNPDLIIADLNIFLSIPKDLLVDKKLKILLVETGTGPTIEQVPEMIYEGIVGILPFSADLEILKKAIKAVSSGELWIDRKTIKNILFSDHNPKKINLTNMEKEIVSLICQGYRNKEIAQKLSISDQTVRSHCNRIYKKIGVSDRLQLVLYSHKMWRLPSKNFESTTGLPDQARPPESFRDRGRQ